MTNLYDNILKALRAHWEAHDNQYPQRIELSSAAIKDLNDNRLLIGESMHFQLKPGWEASFMGVAIVRADMNALIAVNGETILLE